MVLHALSEKVKSLRRGKQKDQAESTAVKEYKNGKVTEKKGGLRRAAETCKVAMKTIARRCAGGPSIRQFNTTKQKVTPAEELVLVDFVKESADRGFPLSRSALKEYADAILEEKHGNADHAVHPTWVSRFLARHHEDLQTHWSWPLDTQRARGLNPVAVAAWFELIKKEIIEMDIDPRDIYGMDESGFPTGNLARQLVIGARGTKTRHAQGSANRENVTAIVTICADGTALQPMVIFKGKNIMTKWGKDNVANATYTFSTRELAGR